MRVGARFCVDNDVETAKGGQKKAQADWIHQNVQQWCRATLMSAQSIRLVLRKSRVARILVSDVHCHHRIDIMLAAP